VQSLQEGALLLRARVDTQRFVALGRSLALDTRMGGSSKVKKLHICLHLRSFLPLMDNPSLPDANRGLELVR